MLHNNGSYLFTEEEMEIFVLLAALEGKSLEAVIMDFVSFHRAQLNAENN